MARPSTRRQRTRRFTASPLERPNFPGSRRREVLDILGVSKQRLHQLRSGGRFPLPMLELKSGPLWMRPAIERWAEAEWKRTPANWDVPLGSWDLASSLAYGFRDRVLATTKLLPGTMLQFALQNTLRIRRVAFSVDKPSQTRDD
jgi:hypothetical protein